MKSLPHPLIQLGRVQTSCPVGHTEDLRWTRIYPFHVHEIVEEEIESVVETLQSGWLATVSKIKQFKQSFAKEVEASHAVAVNSCTTALHLALEAIGITAGDEVIVATVMLRPPTRW